MTYTRPEIGVLIFTCAYVVAFSAYFLAIGNFEFIIYVATMLVFLAVFIRAQPHVRFPVFLLWLLSLWGLAHMAGGGVPVGSGTLYALRVLPLIEQGDLVLLKYDQIVHFYGFGVTAVVMWHVLVTNHVALAGTRSAYAYAALASMGLGTVNEMIEFTAVVVLGDTGVGGYVNNALDLVFNALGAVTAMAVLAVTGSGRRSANRRA